MFKVLREFSIVIVLVTHNFHYALGFFFVQRLNSTNQLLKHAECELSSAAHSLPIYIPPVLQVRVAVCVLYWDCTSVSLLYESKPNLATS